MRNRLSNSKSKAGSSVIVGPLRPEVHDYLISKNQKFGDDDEKLNKKYSPYMSKQDLPRLI